MSEAMRQVRNTLGDDAIIVSSREETSGWVKITAAVEQQTPPPEAADSQGPRASIMVAKLKYRNSILEQTISF